MIINELITRLETNIPVETILVERKNKTFQIYPWLKSKLFFKLIVGEESKAQKNRSVFISQLFSLFYGFWNWFRKYDSWAFTTSVERVRIEGKNYDKLFDGFNNIENHKMLLIELQLFKKFKYTTISSKYAVSKALFMLTEELFARLFLNKINIQNGDLIVKIEEEIGININVNASVRKYLSQYYMMRFWLKILPNPKIVFMSVSYSHFGYILAFKEKGIRVIEMQHGVISNGHHAYFYAKKFNANQFPDTVAVWGENEVEFFKNETEFPCNNCIAIGRSIIELFAQNAKSSISIKTICVSLQDGEFGDLTLDFLIQFDAKSNKKLDYFMQRRNTSKLNYNKRFNFPENFHFFEGSIYENIVASDLHLTAYSTSGLEALSIGKPSVFLNFQNKAFEVFGNQINSNPYSFFVNTFEEFESCLNNLINTDCLLIRKASSNIICPNYFDNISALLENEVKK